ncbi:germination protein [Brevibacillus agri]|uniref:Germination protein n=2 Tax=Brevibacillus agri TaxID=51101 RepID=A0A3M8ATG7_9BACL|nr:Ger(x)C family spore germination protein [Brevibacillus agri]QAV12539.1 Ger(x)C family spore germination protein [Brevibacillus agri]RNB53957.1 Ger(x)C family spore germination protein [Brevibacillus agri]GED26900.1 germination protein [Brevibacillus agri]
MKVIKRYVHVLLILCVVSLLTGCVDRIDLEDATITLMTGIDLNEKDQLLVYLSSPVFSKEAKDKEEEYGVKIESLRQARGRFDGLVTGLSLSGKIQVFVIGKKLLEHPDWFPIMDVMFRDARFTVNARVIVCDGPVKELFNFNPTDKPRLPLHLTRLLDKASQRNLTVTTRLQEFHRQMFEKGGTPLLAEINSGRSVKVLGTALLNKGGKYATLLEPRDTMLLQMLRHQKQGETSLTLPLPVNGGSNHIARDRLSFLVNGVNRSVKTSYRNNRFQFDVKMKIRISITERLFLFDMEQDYRKMEQMISEELRKEFANLVTKCQESGTDPFGFGVYARAYEYEEWKKVQEDWPAAFARADVRIVPEVSIIGDGVIK